MKGQKQKQRCWACHGNGHQVYWEPPPSTWASVGICSLCLGTGWLETRSNPRKALITTTGKLSPPSDGNP